MTEIEKKNRIIFGFENNYSESEVANYFKDSQADGLNYDSNWNSLIPIAQKCQTIVNENGGKLAMDGKYADVWEDIGLNLYKMALKPLYTSVYDFIQYHNTVKPSIKAQIEIWIKAWGFEEHFSEILDISDRIESMVNDRHMEFDKGTVFKFVLSEVLQIDDVIKDLDISFHDSEKDGGFDWKQLAKDLDNDHEHYMSNYGGMDMLAHDIEDDSDSGSLCIDFKSGGDFDEIIEFIADYNGISLHISDYNGNGGEIAQKIAIPIKDKDTMFQVAYWKLGLFDTWYTTDGRIEEIEKLLDKEPNIIYDVEPIKDEHCHIMVYKMIDDVRDDTVHSMLSVTKGVVAFVLCGLDNPKDRGSIDNHFWIEVARTEDIVPLIKHQLGGLGVI